ncbi:MAG: hypothetical protein AAFQ12_05015 [Pseudomonadota bacterium]
MTVKSLNPRRDDGSGLGLKPVKHDANLARQNKDKPDAQRFVEEQATHKWTSINGDILRKAQLMAKQAKVSLDDALERLRKSKAKRDGLNERENMARFRDGADDMPKGADVPFKEWNGYDKLIVIMCAAAAITLLGLGASNVVATILGSGIPVFIEQPYLAWMLGALVPAAAIAIKSGYHLFHFDTSRHLYAMSMFALSVTLILIWIVLFALSFEGASAEIDWDVLAHGGGESGSEAAINRLRNIVQITAEIVIGASLFLTIDRKQATYSSSYSRVNPEWHLADLRVQELEEPIEELTRVANDQEARVTRMEAARASYIGEAISILRDMQSSPKS